MNGEETAQGRLVAGLWCSEVLEALPDLVEAALPYEQRVAVEAHVSACDWCERFGGIYGSLVATLREGRGRSREGLAERLNEALERRLNTFGDEP